MFSDGELRVTRTGHVEDEPGSHKLFQILLADLRAKEKKGTASELRSELGRLQIPTDGSAPKVRMLDENGESYGRLQSLQFESELGIWLDAKLYLPSSPGRKPAVLIVDGDEALGGMPLATIAEQLAAQGRVVLEMETRTSRMKNTEGSSTGDWVTNLQANLIGRNLPAMRAHDILRGVDLLLARPDVEAGSNPGSIRGFAHGVAGVWLLLAAAADARIGAIWLDKTPYSLRSALENSFTIRLSDAVVPNFVLSWDLEDLVNAMGSRRVLWTDPTNWERGVVALGPPYRYRYVVGDITDEANAQDENFIRDFLE
jgi:hypothetical protein